MTRQETFYARQTKESICVHILILLKDYLQMGQNSPLPLMFKTWAASKITYFPTV